MNWPSYLIQINIYLILFYAFYTVILQNETFFKWNRVYLICSGILSFIIPLLQSDWVRKMFVTDELILVTEIIDPAALNTVRISSRSGLESLTIYDWILMIYLTGVAILFIRFIWQLFSIFKRFTIENENQAKSFFRKIKVSDNIPSRDAILKHEEVHSRQLHSADVIFFELISIVNWFNPIVYGYKRSVKYIHEFIADEVASESTGKPEYALILVSNVFNIQKEQLTNNFFNKSLLKKRIKMLNRTKSRKAAILKYGLSVPLFAAMIIFSSATIVQKEISTLNEIDITIPPKIINAITQHETNEKVDMISTPKITGLIKKNILNQVPTNHAIEQVLDEKEIDNDTSVVLNVKEIDVMPEYPGGIVKFLQWVGKEYKYPSEAVKAKVSGRLLVSFIVEKDGALSDIKVRKDLGYGTGEAAVKLLSQSKNWNPGMDNGKPVRVKFTLPLMLDLNKKALADSTSTKSIFSDNSNSPLYIVDGKEITAEEAKFIKPADIKSIEVLKDKQAISKYGEKGKNGVVIITMKPKE